MKTSVFLDHEPVGDGGFLVRALLTIEADAPKDADRTPLNLSLVLDRSGSMWGEKVRAARKAAAGMVQRLWPEVRREEGDVKYLKQRTYSSMRSRHEGKERYRRS
jgi:hypothetical protein